MIWVANDCVTSDMNFRPALPDVERTYDITIKFIHTFLKE